MEVPEADKHLNLGGLHVAIGLTLLGCGIVALWASTKCTAGGLVQLLTAETGSALLTAAAIDFIAYNGIRSLKLAMTRRERNIERLVEEARAIDKPLREALASSREMVDIAFRSGVELELQALGASMRNLEACLLRQGTSPTRPSEDTE